MSSHDQKESGEENTAAKRGSHINIRKKGGAGNGIDGFSVDDELFSSLFFFIFKQGKELTPLPRYVYERGPNAFRKIQKRAFPLKDLLADQRTL